MPVNQSLQRTNNVMERYNRDFNKLFSCDRPSLFNFCECLYVEAKRWLTQHEDALNGIFTGGQTRNNVDWPQIPTDFEGWSPKKRGQKNDST